MTVADTGIGIPVTELPYLFSKFSRGKDLGRLNAGGTGLGLYVGKSMIEANGGRIWAESEGEGQGSRFIIELPVKQSQETLEKWGK
jgi:signal transduction histidine kinase